CSTGARSSRSVYSGAAAADRVRVTCAPSAAGSTMTTPVLAPGSSGEAKLTGTSTCPASAQYGTPTLVPVTVPPLTVVDGTRGSGSDGSRMPAVRISSPAAAGGSSARCRSALPQRTTGSTPVISVASAGTGTARRPTSVSRTAAPSTPSPSPPSSTGRDRA